MRCSAFKNKIYDYMEGDLQQDTKKAMEEHLKSCESCRALYEEEKQMDEAIKNTLSGDEIGFSSSRASIMKNIDKSKYTGTVQNRIGLHIKKKGIKYLSSAAILTLIVVGSAILSDYIKNDGMSANFAKKESTSSSQLNKNAEASVNEKGTSQYSVAKDIADTSNTANKTTEGIKGSPASVAINIAYSPKFEKVISEKDPEKNFATPAKASPDGKLLAQLEGRGTSAADEGVADIFIAKGTTEKWRLKVVENTANFTPMYLEWIDNENVAITMGYANGHATYGGNVYKINIQTGVASLVYEVDSNKEQVAAIERTGNSLKLTVKVFIDDIKNKTKDEERTINLPK